MSIIPELLSQAYTHLESGDRQSASLILETAVNINPVNIEAWEVYMQTCGSCRELDQLCGQMVKVAGISESDREGLLEYYYFLRQKLKAQEAGISNQRMVTFELMDEFTYSRVEKIPAKPSTAYAEFISPVNLASISGYLIICVHLALLLFGARLIARENVIGYWLIMVLAISVFINLWNSLAGIGSDRTN